MGRHKATENLVNFSFIKAVMADVSTKNKAWFSCLTLSLKGTPVNNRINVISPDTTVYVLQFAADSIYLFSWLRCALDVQFSVR